MLKLIIHGCNGQMGKMIAALAEEDDSVSVVAGVDLKDLGKTDFPVFSRISEIDEPDAVVVDFSTAKAADFLLEDCVRKKLPLVLCTTGLSDAQLAKVTEASARIPILKSANMSLGINTLLKLIQDFAKVLASAGFDMEIVERHHHNKVDAPSGTALAMADSLNEAMGGTYHYVYDRSQVRQKRDPKEIGISAIRGGSIVGDHEVIFAGPEEVITINHHAYYRGVFGKGALEAARFLHGKQPGMYSMADVIAARH